jgi:hypothetical protein
MINWTEEDVKFVYNAMIDPVIKQVMQFIETSNDSHNRTIERVVEALDKVSYQQSREIAFLKAIIKRYCDIDPDTFRNIREEYFKQFDELNKKEN